MPGLPAIAPGQEFDPGVLHLDERSLRDHLDGVDEPAGTGRDFAMQVGQGGSNGGVVPGGQGRVAVRARGLWQLLFEGGSSGGRIGGDVGGHAVTVSWAPA